MSRAIALSQGQHAIVDDDDFGWLSQWKWSAQRAYCGYYAMRRDKGRLILMHRLINGTPGGLATDHKDGNGLNNCRCNLRTATQLQNMMNRRGKRAGSSQYKGVWFCRTQRSSKQWRAGIRLDGRLKYLGYFATEKEAGAAYSAAATRHFGEFANSTPGDTR